MKDLVKKMLEEAERELNAEYHDELTDSEYEQYVMDCKEDGSYQRDLQEKLFRSVEKVRKKIRNNNKVSNSEKERLIEELEIVSGYKKHMDGVLNKFAKNVTESLVKTEIIKKYGTGEKSNRLFKECESVFA